MKDEKQVYMDLRNRHHLNESGLRHLVDILDNKLIDHSNKIKELLSKKGIA